MPQRKLIVLMGVSGSGKSHIGALLAERLAVGFLDADELHPPANVEKMARGVPLDDEDRWPWLAVVGERLAAASTGLDSGGLEGSAIQLRGLVVACSALKRSYREAILAKAPGAVFVHLDGPRELLAERMGTRTGHFMPTSLLDSQLATLERLTANEPGFVVGIAATPREIVDAIVELIEQSPQYR